MGENIYIAVYDKSVTVRNCFKNPKQICLNFLSDYNSYIDDNTLSNINDILKNSNEKEKKILQQIMTINDFRNTFEQLKERNKLFRMVNIMLLEYKIENMNKK